MMRKALGWESVASQKVQDSGCGLFDRKEDACASLIQRV